MKKKQQGFALLASILIVLGVVVMLGMMAAQHETKKRIMNNSESFYNRVLYLKKQISAYSYDRFIEGWGVNTASIFPPNLQALEGKYTPICSLADNLQGFCMMVNQTPWGEISTGDYRVVPIVDPVSGNVSHYRAEIDIHLPDKALIALASEREFTLSLLAQVPNVVYDDANNVLTVRIDRPDKALAVDSLVKRSGDDSSLLGDWDAGGNFAITNVKELTVRNDDGSQTRVSNKLTDIYIVPHGTWLDKPKCPAGLQPKIFPSITAIEPHKDYDLTGSQRAYKKAETTTQWQLGLDVLAIHRTSGNKKFLHDGAITAQIQCK